MISKILIGFITLLTCCILFFIISPNQLNATKNQIKTVEVTRNTISLSKDIIGYIKPDISHTIYSEFDGYVDKVNVTINDVLTKQDVVLELNTTNINSKLNKLKTQEALLEKQIEKLNLLLEKEKKHRKNIDYQLLLKEKDVLISKQVLLDENQRELINLINKHKVISPLYGKVSNIYVYENAMIKKGTPLVQIFTHDDVHIEAYLNENLAPYISLNQELYFIIDNTNSNSEDNKINKANVISIYPEIMEVNNQRYIKIKLEPKSKINNDILIGSKVTISLPVEKRKNKLTIPLTALKSENGQYYAMVLDKIKKGKPIKKTLTLGLSDHEKIEILTGLKESDEVIISSIYD